REIADRVYATGFDFVEEAVWNNKAGQGVFPYSKGGTVADLVTIFDELDYPVYERNPINDWVSTLASDTGVVFRSKPIPTGLVPAVIGMGAKDAVAVLENIGLKVHMQGVGRVVTQSQKA